MTAVPDVRETDNAYSRTNPSPRYYELLQQYQALHTYGAPEQGVEAHQMFPGQSLLQHVSTLIQLTQRFGFHSMLDFGCGKGMLYRPVNDIRLSDGRSFNCLQELLGLPATLYDPGYLPYASRPDTPSDLVVCTDVLEHVPAEDIPWILEELFALSRVFVFANIAGYPAKKTLPNGENAHCTVETVEWWTAQIERAAAGYPERYYRFVCTLPNATLVTITNVASA